MMQDDTASGMPWNEAEAEGTNGEEDRQDTGVSSTRWLAAEQTSWLQTGSHRVPRPASVPFVRPKRFRGLPPGVNVVLFVLLVAAIVLAVVFAVQIEHAVHTLTTPVPTIAPTHTVHPTRSATPHH